MDQNHNQRIDVPEEYRRELGKFKGDLGKLENRYT